MFMQARAMPNGTTSRQASRRSRGRAMSTSASAAKAVRAAVMPSGPTSSKSVEASALPTCVAAAPASTRAGAARWERSIARRR